MHPFCEWVGIIAESVKSGSSLKGFSASLGLSECPEFKVELDFILKPQSIEWNEVISSFNLRRKAGNLKEQRSETKNISQISGTDYTLNISLPISLHFRENFLIMEYD